MSVEEFLVEVPSDLNIRERFLDPSNPELSGAALTKFLRELKAAGKQGVLALQSNSGSGSVAEVDREELQRIYADGAEDLGAIYWACLFETINEMIADGQVSVDSFASRVNQFLSDTKVETIVVDDQFKGTEAIPRDVYDGIIKNAQKDKTLAVFIRNPILLPRKIFTFLEKKGILPDIRLIIGEYEARARIIVGGANSQPRLLQ